MACPTRRQLLQLGATGCALGSASRKLLADIRTIEVDPQPLCSQTRRLLQALHDLGTPLKQDDEAALEQLINDPGSPAVVARVQKILNSYALFDVTINPEGRVSVVQGTAQARLWQHGWRVFLVRVDNQATATGRLNCRSQQALPDSGQAPNSRITATGIVPPGSSAPVQSITSGDVADRWLDLQMYDQPPLASALGGLPLEYRIVQLYSRESGQKEAVIAFSLGPGSEDLAFRSSAPIVFDLVLRHTRLRCTSAISITRRRPPLSRLKIHGAECILHAPNDWRLDFPFQDQIYRADNQYILLPQGRYDVTFSRGPEYLTGHAHLLVDSNHANEKTFELQRWVNPVEFGWYPGDHHIHAAGCSHYNTPSQGVRPTDMAAQVRGEGLCFADILTWGPCWYYQKQFFRAGIDPTSNSNSVLRYDVEVSGFPSSYWGHLVLLGLKEQDYPGTRQIEDWPTWNLPILRWAKGQQTVTGYAHTGHGLTVSSTELPNLLIPNFDDNGANEFLIDLAHGCVDFLSAADTPPLAELNLWYHTLNCGFRIPIAGETDFPCLFEKVGVGRSYVYLKEPPVGDAGYREWIEGLRNGRSYVSDGRCHILNLEVGGKRLSGADHEIQFDRPGALSVNVKLTTYLPATISDEAVKIRSRSLDESPFWHIERARIGDLERSPRVGCQRAAGCPKGNRSGQIRSGCAL